MDEPNTTTLLLAWHRGDKAAGNRMVATLHARLMRYFRNKVSDADECVQTTLENVLRLPPEKLRAIGDLVPYALGIAHNVLRAYIRQQMRGTGEPLDEEVVSMDRVLPRTMSSVTHARNELIAFVDGLRELPLATQILLELKYFQEGLSLAAIGEVVGLPLSTLNGKLQRARERLKGVVEGRLAQGPLASRVAVTPYILENWAAEVRAQWHEIHAPALPSLLQTGQATPCAR